MTKSKEQRELLKEIVGRLKDKEAAARKMAAESDSLIAWGRQTMIEEVLLMLYQMHDEMIDEVLQDDTSTEAEDSPFGDMLSKPVRFLQNKMTRRAFSVLLHADCIIVADIYGLGCPLERISGCGYRTHKELLAGLESIGLPDPDSRDTINPENYGFVVIKTSDRNRGLQQWYGPIDKSEIKGF